MPSIPHGDANLGMLPVSRVHEIQVSASQEKWLIESVWAHSGVGIIGGPPKVCKSWLGLDMAVSVASGTDCLAHFPVRNPGPVVVYLAEDSLPAVRSRIEALCAQRHIHIKQLDVFVITTPILRLDLAADQQRLRRTLERLRPRLLLLDPLVRLHRLDENNSSDISGLLGFLRDIQRSLDTAVVLVHHVGKKQRAQLGQALRGSSDLHAFGDSNLYLIRRQNRIIMTLEHRAAKPHDPIELELCSQADGSMTHLKVVSTTQPPPDHPMDSRVVSLLRNHQGSLSRTSIRARLKVNNQTLGDSLLRLQEQGTLVRTHHGWAVSTAHRSRPLADLSDSVQAEPIQQTLPI